MDARAWFDEAGFGLFVHWGIFSARGYEPSWPLVGGIPAFPYGQDTTVEDYYRDAAAWSPAPDAPREWLRLAKDAGMQYAVLTAKHHDGFALFASDRSDFGIGTNVPGRDLVAEFVDATRAAGLRVGLYFSLPDWHHPDYPAWTDEMRPYRLLDLPRPDPERWASFVADQRGQLEDLLTNYGTIDLLWFDGGWERSAREWGAAELESLIRSRQPDILINDRLPGVGDYASPEQSLPTAAIEGRWETCLTMNHSWGPVAADHEHKSVRNLLTTLVEAVGAGGNLLLNISPDGDGRLLDWQRERLEGIASWTGRHREAIIGVGAGLGPGHFHGPSTTRGTTTYLFCVMRPQEQVVLRDVEGARIESIRALGSGVVLPFELRLSALDRILGTVSRCDVLIEVPEEAIDPMITVIEVTARA